MFFNIFLKRADFAGIISLLLIIPAVRIYGICFIVLLHFTVFLLLLDAVVFLIKKLKKQNQLTGLWNKYTEVV